MLGPPICGLRLPDPFYVSDMLIYLPDAVYVYYIVCVQSGARKSVFKLPVVFCRLNSSQNAMNSTSIQPTYRHMDLTKTGKHVFIR